MGQDHSPVSGFTVIAAAAIAAAVAYWIFSADQAPSVPFAIAQYVLLASVTVGGLSGLATRRVRR